MLYNSALEEKGAKERLDLWIFLCDLISPWNCSLTPTGQRLEAKADVGLLSATEVLDLLLHSITTRSLHCL